MYFICVRWGKVGGRERPKKKEKTPWKLLFDIKTRWLITMSWSGRFTHCKYADIIHPGTNADIYASIYQPEVPAQTKCSDYFRNPSKSLLLKFCTEMPILTKVLECWLWTPNSHSLQTATNKPKPRCLSPRSLAQSHPLPALVDCSPVPLCVRLRTGSCKYKLENLGCVT